MVFGCPAQLQKLNQELDLEVLKAELTIWINPELKAELEGPSHGLRPFYFSPSLAVETASVQRIPKLLDADGLRPHVGDGTSGDA